MAGGPAVMMPNVAVMRKAHSVAYPLGEQGGPQRGDQSPFEIAPGARRLRIMNPAGRNRSNGPWRNWRGWRRMPDLLFLPESWEDYLYRKSQDKKTLRRINALIEYIQRNPFECLGKPEP